MNQQIAGAFTTLPPSRGIRSANADFYTGVLGLRLVKRTVNFDDPGTYHLYYGDDGRASGHHPHLLPLAPGATRQERRRPGHGDRLLGARGEPRLLDGAADAPRRRARDAPARFDEEVLLLRDPDGLAIELVARAGDIARSLGGWTAAGESAAIRGFYNVTLTRMEPGGD